MTDNESIVQRQVADYLLLQYPDILFHSDYGSGVKLTPKQAAIQKRQNGGRRAWPDMTIAKRRFVQGGWFRTFEERDKNEDWNQLLYASGALYLELKKDGTRLRKKNGEWATEHIAEQARVLDELRRQWCVAEFAIGFDEAKQIIDKYLGGPQQRKVEF